MLGSTSEGTGQVKASTDETSDVAQRAHRSHPDVARPRVVFFRPSDQAFPEFVKGHFRDQERCLRQFFEVVVVQQEADYDEILDRVQPDLAIFESGVYARRGRSIKNTNKHPHVPKLGFLHSDAYCLTRSVFLADMEEWGVETYFAYALGATGYTPDIVDRTYLWPNFADRAVFHSYPGGKRETILLNGSRAPHYPWRVCVDRLLRDRFPVRSMPHAGWFDNESTRSMPHGESYARLLSSALIVPTCGTVAQEFVRKYVEIPATGALLLAERTPAAEAAGFVDMENCVFADATDVVDKVEYLLENLDVLERIARAGQSLAHAKHSIEHRDQIWQWYELDRRRKTGQVIVQPSLFGPLELRSKIPDTGAVSVVLPQGIERAPLERGRILLARNRLWEAADSFAAVLDVHYEPEAGLGLARSWVGLGRADAARRLLEHATDVAAWHGAPHPDPAEWSWVLRATLCGGDTDLARVRAAQFPRVRHPELDRMRLVIGELHGDRIHLENRLRRRSVHPLDGEDSWESWRDGLVRDLHACSQDLTASLVAALPSLPQGAALGSDRNRRPLAALNRSFKRRQLTDRAKGRLRREWAKRLGSSHEPDIPPADLPILSGRWLDAVILVLLGEEESRRIESYALRLTSRPSVVRIGRASPVPSGEAFEPSGLRLGADATMLRHISEWGRTLIVVSGAGAALLEPSHLADAEAIVVLDVVPTELERQIADHAAWVRAGEEDGQLLAAALQVPAARVWARLASSERPQPW